MNKDLDRALPPLVSTAGAVQKDSSSQKNHSQQATPTSSTTAPLPLSQWSLLFSMLPFTLRWEVSRSYSESKTKQHDLTATTHLLYSLFPLVFGYSIYSLLYISVRTSIFVTVCIIHWKHFCFCCMMTSAYCRSKVCSSNENPDTSNHIISYHINLSCSTSRFTPGPWVA